MPRDAFSNYTLPAANPVITGTTIASSWANNTLNDIATALSQSLSTDGSTATVNMVNKTMNNGSYGNIVVTGASTWSGTGVISTTSNISGGGLISTGAGSIATSLAVGTTLSVGQSISVGQGIDLQAVGRITFPATQAASSSPNVLDDYEEGTATLTFVVVTPGNLGIVYSSQLLSYTKVGDTVTIGGRLAASSFNWTTASGAVSIGGIPFAILSSYSGALALGYIVGSFASANDALCLSVSGSVPGLIALNRVNFPGGTTGAVTMSLLPSGSPKDIVFGGSYKTTT